MTEALLHDLSAAAPFARAAVEIVADRRQRHAQRLVDRSLFVRGVLQHFLQRSAAREFALKIGLDGVGPVTRVARERRSVILFAERNVVENASHSHLLDYAGR